MKIHENWCTKSLDGFHCNHILKPKLKEHQPTKEQCCWCGRIQLIYFITGSFYKPHGKCIKKKDLQFPISPKW